MTPASSRTSVTSLIRSSSVADIEIMAGNDPRRLRPCGPSEPGAVSASVRPFDGAGEHKMTPEVSSEGHFISQR